jgi:hypothetical protein
MDRKELFDRMRQYAAARADLLRHRIGHNFATDERAREVSEGRFFFAGADVSSLCATLKQDFPSSADDIVSRAERICRHRFDLLGYENLDYGAEIDWHCDLVHGKHAPRKPWFKVKYLDFDEVGDSKIIWELNRHQHFVTLAKAYWLSGDDKFVREIFAQWAHWQDANPHPIGINWASSLEVAFRSLSWMWTLSLLRECPLLTTERRESWQSALGLHGRHIETYLSTYFSPNTHLLGEALALFFLGTLFRGPRRAERWRKKGWEILQGEALRQVRKDGFYFEQSTYYHVYALDIFLHARILGGLNGIPISNEFEQILQCMLSALSLLGRAGVPSMIGDDDGGRLFDPRRNRSEHMLDPLATGAVLYGRGDFKPIAGGPREETLWLLGQQGLLDFDAVPTTQLIVGPAALPDSGLYLMADDKSGQQLLIDAGPLGPGKAGHGHADALSICLVRKGRHLLLDPGTFEYVGAGGERARLRGTAAHNTMQVNGFDQADGTPPFSWKNPPQVKVEQWIRGHHFDLFRGSHDGYLRLPSPVVHRRFVFHKKQEFWMVCDQSQGSGAHQLDISWHIGSTLSPDSSRQNLFTSQHDSLELLTAESPGWSQSLSRDYCSPVYGRRELASVVKFSAQVELPAEFATLLIAGDKPSENSGRLARADELAAKSVSAYRYSTSEKVHSFFFGLQADPWTSGCWASDADFLYCSWDRERELYTLVLCNGSYVDMRGSRVLTCGKRVSYAEVLSAGMKVEIYSSDPEHVNLRQPLDRVFADGNLVQPGNDPKGMGV